MLSKKLIIAALFAMLMAAGGVQAGGDAARGQELSEDCAGCDGDWRMGRDA